ncbi:MAG: hypothetical protein Q9M92_09255 [Enterobacterales bacterium]|nr:hypothetical protein [Enterobacterales bacterium]
MEVEEKIALFSERELIWASGENWTLISEAAKTFECFDKLKADKARLAEVISSFME